MATAVANIDETRQAVASLSSQLATRAEQFKMVLPAHIKPEQFQRTVITAVQADPDLLKADRQSLLLACMKAAQDGLLPDKREAALVIFSTRVKQGNQWTSVKQVQYMPMVFGLRKKILQSGEISSITTGVVYLREYQEGYFVYEEGTEAMLRHKPMLELADEDATDDKIVAAYSIAVMKDGTKSYEVMTRAKINKVRQVSQTGAVGRTKYNSTEVIPPKGPWVDWFDEMARKTVMRRHSKTLPMSGDLIDVEARDEELAARSTSALLRSEEAEPPTVLPSREEVPHDPVTGEVLSEEEQQALDRDGLRQMDGKSEQTISRGDAEDWLASIKKDFAAAKTDAEKQAAHDRHAHAISEMEDQHRDIFEQAMAAIPSYEEGPDVSQRGEPDSTVADQIITEIELRTTVPDVNSYVSGQKDAIAAMSEEDRGRIVEAQMAHIAEIKGDKG